MAATPQKLKPRTTQRGVTEGSPARSQTTSPVVRLRLRKTLRMLLSRTSGGRQSDIREIANVSPDSDGYHRKKKGVRARSKLKELFVSSPSPPSEERQKGGGGGEERRWALPVTRSPGGDGGSGFAARRIRSSASLRPVTARLRYRVHRKSWRPVLLTIPEQ